MTPSDSEHTDKDDFVSLPKSIRAEKSDLILAVNDNPPVFWEMERVKSGYIIQCTIGRSLAAVGPHEGIRLYSLDL